jgi:hypothetical protein
MPAAHGARRASRFQLGDTCTNRCRTDKNSNNLSYEEVIKGIGFKTNWQTRVTKRQKQEGIASAEEDSAGADSNGDMERAEQRRAEEELACWYVPCLGLIPQDRPDGVFCLVGENLNCASTKEVRDRKVSDIHRILEMWDVQGGGIDSNRIPQRKRLDSWFRTSQDEYCTSASHNNYEAITTTTRQQGGIAIFCRERISAICLAECGRLQRPGEMEFMDHPS